VLHPDVPVSAMMTNASAAGYSASSLLMHPGVCRGGGTLAGPFKQVPFAPDTTATRALLQAACEVRWTTPGVELVNDGFSLYSTPAGAIGSSAGGAGSSDSSSSSSGGAGNNTGGVGRRRSGARRLLFDPGSTKDWTPGTPAQSLPSSPPAPPSWPACTPVGYASEEAMLAAVVGDDAGGGGYRGAIAVSFDQDIIAGGYTIHASAEADVAALELQERISEAYVAAGAAASSSSPAPALFAVPTMWRSFPLPPVYPSSTYAFVARFLPLAVVVSWVYTLILCAGGVAGEREKGLEVGLYKLNPVVTHSLVSTLEP
jgi:hypothetical protein